MMSRGCVYKHLADTLTWLGVKNFNTRKKMVKNIALHGAREASRALRAYERLTRTKQGGDTRIYDGLHGPFPARPRVGHTTQGPGRKPGASLYTRKRFSLSLNALTPASSFAHYAVVTPLSSAAAPSEVSYSFVFLLGAGAAGVDGAAPARWRPAAHRRGRGGGRPTRRVGSA